MDENSQEFASEIAEADALILKLNRAATVETMELAPRLRYIGVFGTGFGEIDVTEASRRNICVCTVPDYATQGVAEFAVAAIIANLRDMHRAEQNARGGDFDEGSFSGRDLAALRVGIIGAGAIGARFARLVKHGFGSTTVYWSRNRRPELESEGIEYALLEAVLQSSDIVSIHIAKTPETIGFLDGSRLARIKRGALLVSTVPMDVFDLDPLRKLLSEEAIRLVFDHPDEMDRAEALSLTELTGVTAYPPIGYTTYDSSQLKYRRFVDSLVGFISGRPVNRVN